MRVLRWFVGKDDNCITADYGAGSIHGQQQETPEQELGVPIEMPSVWRGSACGFHGDGEQPMEDATRYDQIGNP